MVCQSNRCTCSNPNQVFWNGTYCAPVKSYNETCQLTEGCNPSQNLICNFTESQPNLCTCLPFNYWDPVDKICKGQQSNGGTCSSSVQCLTYSNLYCNGINCVCPSNYYWSTNVCCEFLFSLFYTLFFQIVLFRFDQSEKSVLWRSLHHVRQYSRPFMQCVQLLRLHKQQVLEWLSLCTESRPGSQLSKRVSMQLINRFILRSNILSMHVSSLCK